MNHGKPDYLISMIFSNIVLNHLGKKGLGKVHQGEGEAK
jgi:hypothetical protein